MNRQPSPPAARCWAALQAALTVAVGEEACQFEHRDLHWGNLLIRRTPTGGKSSEEGDGENGQAVVQARLRGVDLQAATQGVTVRYAGACLAAWARAVHAILLPCTLVYTLTCTPHPCLPCHTLPH